MTPFAPRIVCMGPGYSFASSFASVPEGSSALPSVPPPACCTRQRAGGILCRRLYRKPDRQPRFNTKTALTRCLDERHPEVCMARSRVLAQLDHFRRPGMNVCKWLLCAVALLAGINGEATAQGVTTGGVAGLVREASGTPVVAARITAVHGPSGTVYASLSRD